MSGPGTTLMLKVYTSPGGGQGQERAGGPRGGAQPARLPPADGPRPGGFLTGLRARRPGSSLWICHCLTFTAAIQPDSLYLHSWPIKWCRHLFKTKAISL